MHTEGEGMENCDICGRALTPNPAVHLERYHSRTEEVRLPLNLVRVGLLTFVTGGFYLFYWFFRTWQQLASETQRVHYPFWHALSLAVPIYGLFQLHRHMQVINSLAVKSGLGTSLSAGWAVVFNIVSLVIYAVSTEMTQPGLAIGLFALSATLETAIVVLAQSTLNRYWQEAWGPKLKNARVGAGEALFILIIALVGIVGGWLAPLLLPAD